MEKRSFARIPFRTKAIVRHKDSTVIGIVENLSLAGIFLKTPERLGLNRLVKIELLFTGTSSQISIILDGKITRHENLGMAIEFRNIDLDAFFHLNNLITYNTDKIDKVKKDFQDFAKKHDKKKWFKTGLSLTTELISFESSFVDRLEIFLIRSPLEVFKPFICVNNLVEVIYG